MRFSRARPAAGGLSSLKTDSRSRSYRRRPLQIRTVTADLRCRRSWIDRRSALRPTPPSTISADAETSLPPKTFPLVDRRRITTSRHRRPDESDRRRSLRSSSIQAPIDIKDQRIQTFNIEHGTHIDHCRICIQPPSPISHLPHPAIQRSSSTTPELRRLTGSDDTSVRLSFYNRLDIRLTDCVISSLPRNDCTRTRVYVTISSPRNDCTRTPVYVTISSPVMTVLVLRYMSPYRHLAMTVLVLGYMSPYRHLVMTVLVLQYMSPYRPP